MENKRIFELFDSLVTPVALYGSEFWLPLVLSKKGFKNEKNLLDSWETFLSEKLNQKCCRMALSVHNKSSRLAVLGELARYQLFIKSLSHCLNYKLQLCSNSIKSQNLLHNVVTEMRKMSASGQDCWLSRINQLENLLKFTKPLYFSKTSGEKITSGLHGKFERYWLDKINEIKLRNLDNLNHNKLRTYSKFKASFTMEPYLKLVRNRNQRAFLTRLRIGSHHLAVETGRRTRPATPFDQRLCKYCCGPPPTSAGTTPSSTSPPTQHTPGPGRASVDTEFHFLMECPIFAIKRSCLYGKITSINPNFSSLPDEDKFLQLLCPVTAQTTKLVSKFIEIMFQSRSKLDEGASISELTL